MGTPTGTGRPRTGGEGRLDESPSGGWAAGDTLVGGWWPERWERVAPGAGQVVPRPKDGECHLWPVPVIEPAVEETGWLSLLAPAERDRVDRYRSDHARRIFITSRAAQRTVAACYLGRPLREVLIDRECRRCGLADHGRPRIRDGGALDVSVSHAGEWVMLAVVGNGSVGVDLEVASDTRHDVHQLANTVLTATELSTFGSLPGGARTDWFYRCWTRKEAATKLTGHGLTMSPGLLDVHTDRAIAHTPPADWPDTMIHLADAPAPPGFAAAIATTIPLTARRLFAMLPPIS